MLHKNADKCFKVNVVRTTFSIIWVDARLEWFVKVGV